ATLITKNISANGTYNASSDSADGYSQVNVSVPASAVDSGTKNITANGNGQDVVGYAAVDVAVPNSYSAGDEGKVVSNGALVAQTSDTVTTNDTYDTTLINSLTVNVSGGVSLDDIANRAISGDIVLTVAPKAYAFYVCENLTSVTLIGNTNQCVGTNAFQNCTGLTSVFGRLGFSNHSFSGCTSLRTAVITNDASIYGNGINAFAGCTALESVDITHRLNEGLTSAFPASFFQNCTNLETLILRQAAIYTLGNINVFNGTPFAEGGTGGDIYIPKTLYDALGTGTNDYEATTNWSTIDGYGTITWRAIEGSYYETHYADGTVIS
ncbi:MAG: leucine-rich repeat protein, partial [Paludibacteraceae bacterium]|nr:leucine-rich repeat protein [Paludibacteraceae bacterium]